MLIGLVASAPKCVSRGAPNHGTIGFEGLDKGDGDKPSPSGYDYDKGQRRTTTNVPTSTNLHPGFRRRGTRTAEGAHRRGGGTLHRIPGRDVLRSAALPGKDRTAFKGIGGDESAAGGAD